MRQVYLVTNTDKKHNNAGSIQSVVLDKISEFDEKNHIGLWLIDASLDLKQAQGLLSAIRHQLIPNLYLRPIVFLVDSHEMDVDLKYSGCDSVIYQNKDLDVQVSTLISKFEQTNQWIDRLPNSYKASDSDLIFRTLRLIVSRNNEVSPVMTASSMSGFVYPLLESIVHENDNNFLQVLDYLEMQKFIAGNFVSRCYYCCQCRCAFLNFKEICPHCKSEDIGSEELIHHYKCAFIAKKSAFQQGDLLICPKCDAKLKHIGVDFDKPSVMNHCNSCASDFQEPEVITECFNCHNHALPEDQLSREIKTYNATAIGKNAAMFGFDTLFAKIISSKVRFFSEPQFRQFLEVEVERIKRYQVSTSSLGFIKFIDIEKIYLQQGEKSVQFFEELGIIFKSILRLSDVVSTQNQSLFMIILTETSTSNSVRAMERIVEGLSELLRANLQYTGDIPYKIEGINDSTDIDRLLEEFIRECVV